MVSYTEVIANNTSLPSTIQSPTAVFVGATQGIGLGTVRALAKHTKTPTIFLFGRSEERLNEISKGVKEINANAAVHTIQAGDLSLLSNVKAALGKLKAHPSAPTKIDFLILSPGYLSAAARNPTSEGIDKVTSIRYYARMLFVDSLLPLVRAAPAPRVISVLAGGKEGQLWPDDFLLEKHYSFAAANGAAASMLTLFMEELAKDPANKSIGFVHLFPGIVTDTQNLQQAEHWGWAMRMLLGWVVLPLLWPFGRRSEEAGERVLFAATARRFAPGGEAVGSNGEKGSGVYLVQGDSSVMPATKEAKEMREQGMGQKLYKHTMETFDGVQ